MISDGFSSRKSAGITPLGSSVSPKVIYFSVLALFGVSGSSELLVGAFAAAVLSLNPSPVTDLGISLSMTSLVVVLRLSCRFSRTFKCFWVLVVTISAPIVAIPSSVKGEILPTLLALFS